jgi:hypothetical protein
LMLSLSALGSMALSEVEGPARPHVRLDGDGEMRDGRLLCNMRPAMVLRMVLGPRPRTRAPRRNVRAAQTLGLLGRMGFHVALQDAPARAAPGNLGQVDPCIPRHPPGNGRGRNPAGLRCGGDDGTLLGFRWGRWRRRFRLSLRGCQAGLARARAQRGLVSAFGGAPGLPGIQSGAGDVLVRLGDDGDGLPTGTVSPRPPGSFAAPGTERLNSISALSVSTEASTSSPWTILLLQPLQKPPSVIASSKA